MQMKQLERDFNSDEAGKCNVKKQCDVNYLSLNTSKTKFILCVFVTIALLM